MNKFEFELNMDDSYKNCENIDEWGMAVVWAGYYGAELMYRYEYAPDIIDMEQSAFRFINAVSDYVDHTEPLRKTSTWREKRFANNMGNNELLDAAYAMVNSL